MEPNVKSMVKPIGVIVITHDGNLSINYLDRHAIPLTYSITTKRVGGDHPATAGPLPSPITFHIEVPRDALVALRVRSRQLPVIKQFIRGHLAPNLVGFEVATDDTLFKPHAASGAITVFATSNSYADAHRMPAIDITVPSSTEKSVLQVTFYSIPRDSMSVEVFSNQSMALSPGSVYGDSRFVTTSPGWLTTPSLSQTGADIDNVDSDLVLDESDQTGVLPWVLITGTTWWELYQEHITIDMLKAGPSNSSIGMDRTDTGDTGDIMEGCALLGGICHFNPISAYVTIP